MARLAIVFAIAALLGGCFTGPSASEFTPAVSGHGVVGRWRVGHSDIRGELLELRDSAYVVINGEGLFLIPFSAVDGASFSGLGSLRDGTPDAEWSPRLRLVSRFPHGMSDRSIATLLGAARQSELRVLKR